MKRYIPSNCGGKRINLNGAYHPHGQQVIIREDPAINAQSTIILLKLILNIFADKKQIFCISGNARYYPDKLVQEFLASEGKSIQWIFLPPYSPNLNLIEGRWKYMGKQVINTCCYERFEDLNQAIQQFINQLEIKKEQLPSFIGNDFEVIKPGI